MIKTTIRVAGICAALLLPVSAHAMTDAECSAEWMKADTNADGKLTGAEGTIYYSTLNSMKKPVAADQMTKDMFLQNCKSDMFKTVAGDSSATPKPVTGATAATGTATSPATSTTGAATAGAPLAGANSFTEAQAKDRAASAGFSGVSALKKDDSGIWRGTATKDSKTVNIAIDFKGNVVTN